MSDSHNHDPFSPPGPQRFETEAPAPLTPDVQGFEAPARLQPVFPEAMDPLLPSDPAATAPNDRLVLDGTLVRSKLYLLIVGRRRA